MEFEFDPMKSDSNVLKHGISFTDAQKMWADDGTSMKATEFDEKFDAGESVMEHLALDATRRPGREQRRVNVDFPSWVVDALDEEAARLGVTRQSVIKVWIAERIDRGAA